MQTQPSVLPASLTSWHTSLPVPAPVHGVVHVPLSATPAAQGAGVAGAAKHPGKGLS